MPDDGSDAGAAHGEEAGLQPVVVAVPRPLGLDPAQDQRLVQDGSGLQAQVLAALRVQAASQQAARLGQQGGEQGVVPGDAEDGDQRQV